MKISELAEVPLSDDNDIVNLKITSALLVAGYFTIAPAVKVAVRTKPNWWHRLWAWLLLGWTWEDRL